MNPIIYHTHVHVHIIKKYIKIRSRRFRGVSPACPTPWNRVIVFVFAFVFVSFVRASGRGEAVRVRERGVCFHSLGLARESSPPARRPWARIFCAKNGAIPGSRGSRGSPGSRGSIGSGPRTAARNHPNTRAGVGWREFTSKLSQINYNWTYEVLLH